MRIEKQARRVGPDGRPAVRNASAAEDRGVRATRKRAHGDMQPAPSGSVRYGGVLDYAVATELRGRALGVHQAAVVRVQEGASRVTTTSNRSVLASLRGRALQCDRWLGCAAQPPATACGVGMHLGGHGLRERLQGAKRTG